MNFDKLSRFNDKKDENVVVSIIEPVEKIPQTNKSRPTVFSAFMANFKQDKELIYPSEGAVLPNLKGTLNSFIALVFLSAVMVASWYFIDRVVFIPVAIVFLSIAVPCLIMVFYYEFDVGRIVPLGKLFLLAIIGALCYIVVSQIMSEILYLMFDKSLVESVFMPVVSNIIMFAVIFLATSFFQSDSVRDYFLIVTFLVMGYVVCECIVKGFSSLFISGKVDGTTLYDVRIIIDNKDMLEKSMENLMSNLMYDFIVLPLMYSCWGTVYAYLVYYLAYSKRKRINIPKSMYLLVFLVIVLNILFKVDTSMPSFNVILRLMSAVVSVYVLIKLLNFSFDEAPPRLLKDALKKHN